MKRFIINSSVVVILVLLIFSGSILWRIHNIRSRTIDFSFPSSIHYIFTGASHSYYGIDDELMTTAVNNSQAGERYMFSYLRLKEVLKYNPQIDTVFIQLGPTDLYEHADDRYFQKEVISYFGSKYYPFFTYEEWRIYKGFFMDFLLNILKINLSKDFKVANETKIKYGGQGRHTAKMDPEIFKSGLKESKLKEGQYKNEINFRYLRKIINLCEDRGVKLIAICFPLYHQEDIFDLDYFYRAKEQYFKDLEFYDYMNFSLPDSARADAHHLNYIGAEIFTKEIMSKFNIK